jgi:hypothetical protein
VKLKNFCFVIFLFLCSRLLFAGGVMEFKMVSLRSVTDPHEIDVFRTELFLGNEKIDRILITDILNDGFDESDIAQLYPSGRVIRLQPISANLDQLLRSYTLPPNAAIFEAHESFPALDSLAAFRSGGRALGYGILAGIEERLAKGYRGDNVEGYFKVGSSGSSVEIWNFDSSRVSFPMPLPPAKPRVDTAIVVMHDTIFTTRIDTVLITPVPVVIHDTVRIPENLLKSSTGVYYREALGTIGGEYDMNHRESSRGKITLGAGNEWDFGVWDPWINGKQEINKRGGLRFLAEMAPWKSDTLSPRFLSTTAEGMYIPGWDQSFFAFGGIRLYYKDNLFWDGVRAAWDDKYYKEPTLQNLSQYELSAKLGLDKFTAFGMGKRFGAWLKLSGWLTGGDKSRYELNLKTKHAMEFLPPDAPPVSTPEWKWHWEHDGGSDIEGAVTLRITESAQIALSVGQLTIANLYYDYLTDASREPVHGLFRLQQFYQTASVRFVPFTNPDKSRLVLEASFRNNTVDCKYKQGLASDKTIIDKLFVPYFESPVVSGSAQYDIEILRITAGVKYYMPSVSGSGNQAQIQPYGGLSFMFR